MKEDCFELLFQVTETLNNGKERTFKKKLLSPRFRNGHYITEANAALKGIELLQNMHYYRIKYMGRTCKTLYWID